jgi:hypothetical protein
MKASSIILAAAAAVTLAGCAASGVQVSEQAALQFQEGRTTEAEILQKLGKPTSVHTSGGIRLLQYSGFQYQVKGATFVPIVGAFAGGADYTLTTATYQIDPATSLLQKISYTQQGTGSRAGTLPAPMPPTEPSAVR